MEKYNIIITSRAQADLVVCVGFVLNVSKEAAKNLANEFKEAFASLETWPERNPLFNMPSPLPALRKKVIAKRYIALYAIEGKNVVVYSVLDSRRGFDQIII